MSDRSPAWFFRKHRRMLGAFYHVGTEINRKIYSRRDPGGIDVVRADWDNLIILDGCRHDLYTDVANIDGDLSSVRSRGSSSSEFIENNFAGRGDELYDTVYVTANATIYNISNSIFHDTRDLIVDDWDDDKETVLPQTVYDHTLDALDEYPDKRLVIHFMQPHYPFLGATGEEIEHSGIRRVDEDGDAVGELKQSVWWMLKYGEFDRETVWEAYRENLKLVLPFVQDMLEVLPGRTVITSDHGNLLGDRIGPFPTRGFGHPSNLYVDELINVPWQVCDNGSRREVTKDPPITEQGPDSSLVDDRLRELGYL